MTEMRDFNNIKQWLQPLLTERNLSVEKFAEACGLARPTIYHFFTDRSRPSEQVMVKMCQVLGVPLEEGMRQYTPRRRGRPKGSGGLAELPVRQR